MKETYRTGDFVKGVIVLSLVVLLLFSSGLARAERPARLKVGIIPITEMLTMFVATEKGYFAREGLEVETAPMAGGATIIPALVGGSIDLGYSNVVSIILAKSQGLPLKIIVHNKSENTVKTPDTPPGYKGGSAIMVRSDSDIRTAKDLERKKVAVNTLNNINWLLAQEWMRMGGADPAKSTWVELPFPNMGAALETGQVDAITAAEPTMTILRTTGKGKVLDYYFSAVKPNVMVASFVATEKEIKERPEAIQKFVRAMSQAIEYLNTHTEEWPTILAKNLRIDLDLIKKMGQEHRFDPRVNLDDLGWYADLCLKRGLISKRVAVKEMVWSTALEK